MTMIALIRRLVGNSHEQLREQHRFEQNLKFALQQGEELDRLQRTMSEVVGRVTSIQHRVQLSILHSGASGEHNLGLGDTDVRRK